MIPKRTLLAALALSLLASCGGLELAAPETLCEDLQEALRDCRARLDCSTLEDEGEIEDCMRREQAWASFDSSQDGVGCPLGAQRLAIECLGTLSPETGCRCGVR